MNSLELRRSINEKRLSVGKNGVRHDDLVKRIAKRFPKLNRVLIVHDQNKREYSGYAALSELEVKAINESELSDGVMYGERESGALSAIEQLLGIELVRQYGVIGYRIDGYCEKTNTAYEIDESQHFVGGELREDCLARQHEIELELGCKFVRIKV